MTSKRRHLVSCNFNISARNMPLVYLMDERFSAIFTAMCIFLTPQYKATNNL